MKSLKEIEDQFFEFIFILDRCTDNSESIVMQWFPDARIVRKESNKWKNSLAENSQLGFEASKGNIVCTQDADATAPHDCEGFHERGYVYSFAIEAGDTSYAAHWFSSSF